MTHTTCLCFALLVQLVDTKKIHYEEQALVEGTKQSSKADKAVGPACYVLCLLALFCA
jgi:hypothetical protein